MPIKAQAGFKAQRVPRAQPDRAYQRIVQQHARQIRSCRRARQHLEPVFAGIAAARHRERLAAIGKLPALHELQFCAARKVGRQHLLRLRPLQRKQHTVIGPRQHGLAGQRALENAPVLILHRAVDDDIELALAIFLIRTGDDQVIEDAAVIVQQHGQPRLSRLQPANVGGHQRLDQRRNLLMRRSVPPRAGGEREQARPHMAHVEQPGLGPRPEVLVLHAGRKLHRHLIAREGHELGAEFHMQGMQGGAPQGLGNRVRHGAIPESRRSAAIAARPSPPLSLAPERFRR